MFDVRCRYGIGRVVMSYTLSAIYDVMKSDLARVLGEKIRNGLHGKQGLLCDKIRLWLTLSQTSPGVYASAIQVF